MRASPARLSIDASYTGLRCRLNFHVPQSQRFIPLNSRGWTKWEKGHIRAQHVNDGVIEVGIYNQSFKPLRPMDLIVAGQALADQQVDTVVLAPHDNVVSPMLDIMAKFLWPLFSVSDLKEGRSPQELVTSLMRLNTLNERCNLQFNWISSRGDAAAYMIAQAVDKGLMGVDQAIDRYVTPEINSFIYYYFKGEDSRVVDILAKAKRRVRLIELSEEFFPLQDFAAALSRNGRINCGLISSPAGLAVTFALLVGTTPH